MAKDTTTMNTERSLKATIETGSAELIALLQPIVDIVTSYEGHLNWSYTHGAEHITTDVMHKGILCDKIRPHLGDFLMGTGAGHIWISVATHCTFTTDYKRDRKGRISSWSITDRQTAADIHSRVLLIIDAA